ncbi:hypothetical protein ACFQ45_13095 [Rhodanobacter aciditrophus]|uniref:Uncharacterized protein n=1 Tax=Rhodanobacter aciditrophus TaxID=1623218 RepID=A0ABW4B283_9GAMM
MTPLELSRSQLAAFMTTRPPQNLFYHLLHAMKEEKAVINQEAENRFFNMLEAAPELKQYWDADERMPKMRSIQTVLHNRPKEDGVLLRFFGSVWFGNSDMFDFDFMHAMKCMNDRELKIVRRWMAAPFWP